ncbi:DUF1810 family protein [Pedobacter roseus]|uniref:DUF1810 family protein n=1 Tax=Pedobacter roseus TaxID=336820 RepID=A0A7G9QHV1_9SPHI|nr:DUF1810 family protein [Pedobacter roseus]
MPFEISRDKKQSHWRWYIYPQMQGLGFSDTTKPTRIGHRSSPQTVEEEPVIDTAKTFFHHAQ